MSEQLSLFTIPSVPVSQSVHDPYWDEIVQEKPLKDLDESVLGSLFTEKSVRPHDTQKLADEHSTTSSPCFDVRPQVINNTQQFADEHTHWVQEYWVKRGDKKHYYYRYCWMVGRKKNCIHIGSVNSAIAKNRKSEIESAIIDGQSPIEIEQLICSWRGGR
jgi:hypothetical protein